ncbi:MAG: hypothetical protein BJ554DRAFT_5812, partial [Olpidium bornovanus]
MFEVWATAKSIDGRGIWARRAACGCQAAWGAVRPDLRQAGGRRTAGRGGRRADRALRRRGAGPRRRAAGAPGPGPGAARAGEAVLPGGDVHVRGRAGGGGGVVGLAVPRQHDAPLLEPVPRRARGGLLRPRGVVQVDVRRRRRRQPGRVPRPRRGVRPGGRAAPAGDAAARVRRRGLRPRGRPAALAPAERAAAADVRLLDLLGRLPAGRHRRHPHRQPLRRPGVREGGPVRRRAGLELRAGRHDIPPLGARLQPPLQAEGKVAAERPVQGVLLHCVGRGGPVPV